MDEHSENATLIRRYLLGETEDEDTERAEKLLLTSADEFENAIVLEDELADEYVQGQLTSREEASFEKNYTVTKDRRQTVWFAGKLRSYAFEKQKQTVDQAMVEKPVYRRWFHFPLTTHRGIATVCLSSAIIVLIASSAYWARRSWKDEIEIEAEHKKSREISDSLANQLAQLKTKQERPVGLQKRIDGQTKRPDLVPDGGLIERNLILEPGLFRGAGNVPSFAVPVGTLIVEIDLRLPGKEQDEYRVRLYDSQGTEISMQLVRRVIDKKGKRFVPVKLPIENLPSGYYRLELQASTNADVPVTVGNYYFRFSPEK